VKGQHDSSVQCILLKAKTFHSEIKQDFVLIVSEQMNSIECS